MESQREHEQEMRALLTIDRERLEKETMKLRDQLVQTMAQVQNST
jgi:hypothetical protein